MAYNVRSRDEIGQIVTSENCLAAVWYGVPSVEHFKKLEQAGQDLAAASAVETIFLNIMLRGTPSFSPETRTEAARQTRENSLAAVAGAHVVVPSGIIAATARTFMSTVLLLGRSPVPIKVFANMESAASWLLPFANQEGGPIWTVDKLVALYEQLRAD